MQILFTNRRDTIFFNDFRYNRDWRYHTEEKVWISRAPGNTLIDKTSSYERGTYFCFDPQKWRKLAKEFLLEYSKLEERPPMPQHAHMYPPPGMQQASVAAASASVM